MSMILSGGTADSQGENSLFDSLSSFAAGAAKTAATVKSLFSDKPTDTPDVVGEVRVTVPQLAGMDLKTIGILAFLVVAVFVAMKR